MKTPGHVMILASAGSGKTHALTNRFVRLLAGGAAPERIVALTFTRKAAGEFFDEILHRLARAAGDAARARALAAEVGEPALGPEDFLRMLRTVVDAMPRLSLGTLDSFFARIVRSFPLELGLGGEFVLLEEPAARREQRKVMERLFTASGEPDLAQREFLEAFKRATFGVEEKQLARWLGAYLAKYGETFLDAPGRECWGNPARIWPGGSEWLKAAGATAPTLAPLRAALPWEKLSDGQRARLEDFFAEAPAWRPGAPLPDAVGYLVKNSLAVWDQLRAGRADLTVDRKKISLDPAACTALASTVRSIVGGELGRRLEVTRGIFAVLHGYESIYADAVRRSGRLTFSDVQRLLLPAAGAPQLSGTDGGDGRLLIDWRLDAHFDHWLLDEFQDTSYAQWSILRNLVDEAVQDADHRRSLFYVGDVKQAIYAWREGDPRLFREIFDHYNRAAPGTIAEQNLTSSWRSGPPVIAMVNAVFGDEAALRALVPETAASRWTREWRTHTSAKPELGGHAELRHAEDEAGRFAETLRILQEVEPARRNLTTAVLVQTNDTGARLADYLRREGGLAAVAESDRHVATDNPLTAGLLALLQVAAHPGDTFAREHVAMTPLQAVLESAGLGSAEDVTTRLLAEVQADGFAKTIERWVRLLEPHLAASDSFSRLRGSQLVEAARKFDDEGRRDVADFLTWAAEYTVREAETAGVVRVLTVHKAKGLGFDVVILPDVEGLTLARRRSGLAVQRGEDRSVEWVLDMPAGIFHESDAVLRQHVAAGEADEAYEALCKFYVALTRAKRALYVVCEPVGRSTSRNFPRLLRDTLGEQWTAGDPAWFAGVEPTVHAARPLTALIPVSESAKGRRRLLARRPSEAKPDGRLVPLFGPDRMSAAEFGTRVHALFETVEWWDEDGEDGWVAARKGEGADSAALAETLACLRSPELAEMFARPSRNSDVRRERAFEVILDGTWVTGVFDRLVITRNETGRAVAGWVIDFKTDRSPDDVDFSARAVERHAGQLNLYRRVAASLAGLSIDQVRCTLVLTAERSFVDVSCPG